MFRGLPSWRDPPLGISFKSKRTRSSTGQSIGLRNRGLGVRIPPGVLVVSADSESLYGLPVPPGIVRLIRSKSFK